jgi:CubicO group peptidase (beta-lactamase class C family)
MPRHIALILASVATLPTLVTAHAQTSPYDFSELTQLAEGAIAGQNVGTPVPGFDLLILRDGRTVYHRSFGDWSIDRVAAADSAGKTLSGAVILSLTDNVGPGGPPTLSLNSRLSDFMSAYTGEKEAITIRQCFSHSAGFGPNPATNNPFTTLQQAAVQIAADPLDFPPPGSTFSYGSTSMHAAGAAAEIASGRPWNGLVFERITGPLAMTNTRYVLFSTANPLVAGGAESTASEFGRFMEMLRRSGLAPDGRRILSADACRDLFTRQTAPDIVIANSPYIGNADYGVGVWLDRRTPTGVLRGALAAGARGFSSWVDFDDGLVGVFATDTTGAANVSGLTALMRTAAENAVRANPCHLVDRNADGQRTPEDIFIFLNTYFAPEPRGDFDGNGARTPSDIFAFLTAYFAGC